MNEILERVKQHFSENIQIKINTADSILPSISYAAEKIVQCLLEGNKILVCGTGGSAYQALHFCSKLLNRYQQERPSLPAIALTSDISAMTAIQDGHYADIFAKQLRTLGQSGDILLVISTSGNSLNILHTIKSAQDKKMIVVALTGGDGGKIPAQLQDEDIEIRVPTFEAERIQETHLLILHCLSDSVDFQLFGHGETVT